MDNTFNDMMEARAAEIERARVEWMRSGEAANQARLQREFGEWLFAASQKKTAA